MRRIALLLLLAATSAPAIAADWRHLGTGSDGRELYLDMGSVDTSGPLARAWLRYDLSKVRATRARSTVQLAEIDCPKHTMAIIQAITYAPRGGLLSSEHDPHAPQEPVAPDTLGEDILGFVCR